MEQTNDEQKIKEREERTFKIKHEDACFIVFKNGDIIATNPNHLYNALNEYYKNLIQKNIHKNAQNTPLSNQDK